MRYKSILPYLTNIIYKIGGRYKLRSSPTDLSCQPFFILGSGRNGSTLLSMILNGHSKVFIPGEQFALHYAAIRFQLYNFLMWRDLVKIIIGEFADSKRTQGWDTSFNALYDKLYNLPKNERSFQRLVDSIIKEVAQQKEESFEMWGDKTPSTIWFLEYIYRVYPRSKYIFLIRDGRDVVNSYKEGGVKMFDEMSDITNAAKNWQTCVNKWHWLKERANPNQLLEVKYESLVSNPQNEVSRILSFLGYSYEDGITNYECVVKRSSILEMPFHQGLAKPINNNSVGKWETELNKDQLSIILPLVKKGLVDYGYLKEAL